MDKMKEFEGFRNEYLAAYLAANKEECPVVITYHKGWVTFDGRKIRIADLIEYTNVLKDRVNPYTASAYLRSKPFITLNDRELCNSI